MNDWWEEPRKSSQLNSCKLHYLLRNKHLRMRYFQVAVQEDKKSHDLFKTKELYQNVMKYDFSYENG